MRPYLDKKPSQKRARGEAQVGPEFKPQYSKKKKRKKNPHSWSMCSGASHLWVLMLSPVTSQKSSFPTSKLQIALVTITGWMWGDYRRQ
jgi:hypothetical protein